MDTQPRPDTSRRPTRWTIAALAVLSMLAVACGGSAEGSTTGVASLEDVAAADEPSTETSDTTLAADEAALEFSQCMRDEGLDFPDVGVDAEGNPDLRSSFVEAGLQPGSEEFQAAMTACGEILQDAGFGGGGRRAALDDPDVQDALVAFSECLRDEGLDVGDLQLGGGQGGQATDGQGAEGDGPQRGQGQGQGGFANRTDRFARQLDLDTDDPAVAAALDGCTPILDEALGQLGRGANG